MTRSRKTAALVLAPIIGLLVLSFAVVGLLSAHSPNGSMDQLKASPISADMKLPAQASPRDLAAKKDPAVPTAPAVARPEEVQVGMYINRLLAVDLATNTFEADFYMWFRWRGAIDPTTTYSFVNQTEAWGAKIVPVYEEPTTDATGLKYQGWHIQTKFVQPLDFGAYPKSGHDLNILIEDGAYDASQLVYVQPEALQVNPTGNEVVGGWRVENPNQNVATRVYDTNFGDPAVKAPLTYSQANFAVSIERSDNARLVKAVIPITIIIAITLLAFIIGSKYLDARLLLTVTAMISAVLLHDASVAELPPVGYLVVLDKIYLLSYLVVFLTLLESCIAFRINDRGNAEKAAKLDKISVIALAALFVGGTAILILLT